MQMASRENLDSLAGGVYERMCICKVKLKGKFLAMREATWFAIIVQYVRLAYSSAILAISPKRSQPKTSKRRSCQRSRLSASSHVLKLKKRNCSEQQCLVMHFSTNLPCPCLSRRFVQLPQPKAAVTKCAFYPMPSCLLERLLPCREQLRSTTRFSCEPKRYDRKAMVKLT